MHDHLISVVSSLATFAAYRGPEHLTAPGEQVQMFLPCLYCGHENYTPSLPARCGGCRVTFRGIVQIPAYWGPSWFRVLRYRLFFWRMHFRSRMRDTTAGTVISVFEAVARR